MNNPDVPGTDIALAVDRPPDPRSARARKWLLPAWIAIGAGVAILLAVGWEFWGTNLVARAHQHRALEALKVTWAAQPFGTGEASTPTGVAFATIQIPQLGAGWIEPILQGVGDEQLASGVGHFRKSAEPGQVGNFAVAGHRVTNGEPFRDFMELRPGDQVIVGTIHHVYVYKLDTRPEDLTVPFTQGWVVSSPLVPPTGTDLPSGFPHGPDASRMITLATCSEFFHTDNRSVVYGHLVSSTPR